MKRALPWVLVLALVAWLYESSRRDGIQELVYRARVDSLRHVVAKTDTIRKTDSVRVTRYVTTTQTLRDTVLQHLTDTVAVKEYVYRTDTLRTACLACLASAARLSVANDSLQRAYTGLVRVLDAQKPPRWQKYLPLAAGVAGFILGAKLRP